MILTGENWSTGRKTCQWQIPHGLSELHPPFALSEQGLTSQTLNVKILFHCYIACKDSHIIDKMCLIIICNWRIILRGLSESKFGTGWFFTQDWNRWWVAVSMVVNIWVLYCIMWEIYWFCNKLVISQSSRYTVDWLIYNLSHFENVLLWQLYWI